MWGNMVDRSLRMWRFTLRLPHYVVKFIGFKLQQVKKRTCDGQSAFLPGVSRGLTPPPLHN